MIDSSTVDRILDASQIVDVVSDFITLKKRGANYIGLCPFHEDKTPSLSVSPAKGIFKCFACGKAGNAAGFVMEHEQLSYPDALRYLARKYGIEIEEKQLTEEERQSRTERESLFVVNEFARDYFHRQLHESEEGKSIGLAYFRGRGFRDDIIEKFQLGYSSEKRDSLSQEAISKVYKKEYLLKTGLVFETDDHRLRDRFRGRVMFPFHTLSGKVVAFGGRVLAKETKGVSQKYINSPESEIFVKGNTLYGLYFAKQAIIRHDCCYLVEGYTDVISMHQSGIENVVASSGTALTDNQIRLLRRFTNNITLLYDGDEAGIKAALRGTDMLLAQGMNVKVCLLPDGDDPDSFARKHNATEYQEYIEANQTDFIRFKTMLLVRDANANDPIKRAGMIGELMESISLIPEAITRDIFLKECSQLLQMDVKILVDDVAKRRERRRTQEAERAERERQRQQNVTVSAGEEQTSETTTPENATVTAATTDAPAHRAISPGQPEFERYEFQLAQMIVRYGECTMFNTTDEQGKETPVSVIEYIANELKQDELSFHHPIYGQILEEAVANKEKENFKAEHFFVHHTDPEICQTSVNLISNRYALSKYHRKNQTIVDDCDRLPELVSTLMFNFKYAVISSQLKELLRDLQLASNAQDENKCNELMQRYSQLHQIQSDLAKRLGDRVVLGL